MQYGEGPPDGFSAGEWRSALQLQNIPEESLTRAQRELVNRPRLWNGMDPHGDIWTARQRREWDAAIYNILLVMPARKPRVAASRKKTLAAA